MKYPAYPRYRDSGVAWLRNVPEHWEVKWLKYSAQLSNNKVEADGENPLPYVGMEHVEPWTGKLLPLDDELVPDGISNRFHSGDLLFGKLRPYLAKACEVDFDGLCSSELFVLRSKGNLKRFLLYQLLSEGFVSLVDSSTYGSKMPRASWDFVGHCSLPTPPPDEQAAIADFLDAQTAGIDTLVGKKRGLVERLKEKRTALISRTVTRGLPPDAARAAGLDPNPPLKPSGIEWLGDIPEHWETKRLKYSASLNDEALPESTPEDYDLVYVVISCVNSQGEITDTQLMGFGEAPSRARRVVRDGDTILSTVRTYLKAIAPIRNPEPNMIASTGFAVVRPRAVHPGYLAYSLRSSFFVESVVARSVGVSYPAIAPTSVATMGIPLPLPLEQQTIADYLDRETGKMDRMVEKVEEAIEKLQEYRTALITAAVTGKIDVREVAA